MSETTANSRLGPPFVPRVAEITKVEAALARYFDAFEDNTLDAATCAPRIQELTGRLRGLHGGQAELAATIADSGPKPLTPADVAALAAQISDAFRNGDPHHQKALLQALITDIRVNGKANIQPHFAIHTVRPPTGSVPPTGIEAPCK